MDLALLTSVPPFRPPDTESPPLRLQTIAERSLFLAVPATHPLARDDSVDVADLRGQRWITSLSSGEERLMRVWPGLDERPEIAHTTRDWLAKLRLVAAGCGVTTVPALVPAMPSGFGQAASRSAMLRTSWAVGVVGASLRRPWDIRSISSAGAF